MQKLDFNVKDPVTSYVLSSATAILKYSVIIGASVFLLNTATPFFQTIDGSKLAMSEIRHEISQVRLEIAKLKAEVLDNVESRLDQKVDRKELDAIVRYLESRDTYSGRPIPPGKTAKQYGGRP